MRAAVAAAAAAARSSLAASERANEELELRQGEVIDDAQAQTSPETFAFESLYE